VTLKKTREGTKLTVVLDFGHGGSDQGAQGINITEAVAAQITGNRIKKHLEDMGVEVILTRSNNSTYPTLTQRAQLAKDVNADAFVAVHYNKFDTVANGFEIYRHTDSNGQSIDFALQDAIHQKVAAVCLKYGVRNRGAKANDYQVLRELQNSGVAAVLIEGLFIDNVADMEFFMGAYHEEYAFSVAEGIVQGLTVVEVIEAKPPTTTIIDFVGKAKGDLDNSRIIKYEIIKQLFLRSRCCEAWRISWRFCCWWNYFNV
jgi:N-acetylmuramoyl-L-alanine amidase